MKIQKFILSNFFVLRMISIISAFLAVNEPQGKQSDFAKTEHKVLFLYIGRNLSITGLHLMSV